MARQVLPIVGAVVGAYFGNPQLGYAIGSIIGNAVDPQVIEGPALGEGQVNTAREGGYRPIVLGTGCVGCNIINVGPEKVRTHRERQSKGGGPVSETKRRYRTFALRICEGPIAGLLRIWQGEKLVYDARSVSVIAEDSSKYAEGFTLYLGNETQLPDPDLEAYLGAGNVNAYRGTAYIVFTNFDLTDTQGAIPNFRFEVAAVGQEGPDSLYWSSSDRTQEDEWGILLYEEGKVAGGFNDDLLHTKPIGVRGVQKRYEGKYLFEVETLSHGVDALIGVLRSDSSVSVDPLAAILGAYVYGGGVKVYDTSTTFPDDIETGDRITVLWDNGKVWFKRNGDFLYGDMTSQPNGLFGITLPGGGLEYAPFFQILAPHSTTPEELPTVQLYVLDEDFLYPQAGFDQWGEELDPGISAGEPVPLSSIVSFIHQRCGHSSGQYDVAELTDMVDGVVFADSYTGSDAIRTILPIYFADASEHDAGAGYKINYVKRGKPVVRTLVLDDLVDEPQEATRLDSLERAAKFHIHFQNPTIGYAAAKATSSRSSPDVTSNVTGEISVQVPITFADVNEAAQRSNILHKVSWVEVAGTQEIMVSDADMDLVPTDVIGLYLRGILTRYRMVTQEYIDGTLKCEFMADRQSAYTSNVTGIPLPEPEPPPSSIVGPTISVFGDWPALVDGHDALIAYAAATGQSEAWWGATYQRSLDAGANYTTAATFDDFNTIMGTLQDALPDASEHYTDTTNVVRVSLYTEDQIESLTQQQFLSEGGGFALSWENSEGTQWEMLQYRDAEQDSNGDWILSHLLRGRLDTDTAEHPPGATFVLLDNSLKVMPMQSAWLGMELTHRAYSNGETPESAIPYDDEFTGKSQREWPVANLLLERSGDDIEAIAIPRHRFGTDDAPVQSVNHSGYRWTATDGVNTVNIDTVMPTQTFDVTGWSTPITVTVAQLNRITGAGPSVSEEIA